MPDESKFAVRIETTADRSGAQQVEGDLDRIKEKAAEASAPATGATVPFDSAAHNAQLESEAAIREQMLATEQQAATVENERALAEARRNSIIVQRQALIASEVEALALEAAGQTEQAAALTAEIELRRAALQIQQSTNLSEEESLLLARQRITAEEQIAAAQLAQKNSSALAGVNIGRARQEATTLVREIATGTVNMRTLGALAGSLGPALGVSAIAALVVGEVISSIGKKLDDNRISSEKESVELQKQIQHWKSMAAAAKDFSDVQKLTEDVSARVSEINEKIRQTPGEASGGFFETELNGLKLISNFFGTTFQTSTDAAIKKQAELRDVIEQTGKTYEASAKRQVEAVRAIIALPYPEAIRKAQTEIARLTLEQESLNRSDKKQEESWQRKQSQIAAVSRAIDDVAQRQALLDQRQQISSKIAAEGDPQRRAAFEAERNELDVKLLLQKKIQEANDKAAKSGKALSAEEKKAIEEQLIPLREKLKILQQIVDRQGPGAPAAKAEIDKLTQAAPPTAAQSERLLLEQTVANARSTLGEVQRAKAQLDLLDQARVRALDRSQKRPGSLEGGESLDDSLNRLQKRSEGRPYTESLDRAQQKIDIQKPIDDLKLEFGRSLAEVKLSLESVPPALTEAFAPIPTAVDGVKQNIESLGSTFVTHFEAIGHAVIAVAADTDRKLDSLQKQIDILARPTPQ